MALLVDCAETVIGVPMADTYARITNFQGDKTYVSFVVEHYATEQARNYNAQPLVSRMYTTSTDDVVGGFPAMYEWLKQQADYTTAEDC
jgi:hypothetical protein